MFSRSIIDYCRSVIDDSRVLLQLVASFKSVIYIFTVQATKPVFSALKKTLMILEPVTKACPGKSIFWISGEK